jgi:hypothetical protein
VNDPIANALNITPLKDAKEVTKAENKEIVIHQSDDQVENDFEYARRNMYDIIGQGQEAIARLMDIADQSQHPRAYEVIANLIKTMADTNKDLLDLTKKKRDLQPKEEAKQQQVTNNLFVGSTAELQQLLQKKSEENK